MLAEKKKSSQVPPADTNIGSINSLQWLLNTVKGLFKVDCPIWVVIGRHYNVNRCVGSKVSPITGPSELYLNYLEKTERV